MKFGNYPDEPIPPLSFNLPKKQKHNPGIEIAKILDPAGRKVNKMLPDGNCFFRSLSFCFHQTQDRHMEIRTTLVEFITKNCDDYKPLLFEGTLDEHLKRMRNTGTWGTQWNSKLLQIITRHVSIYSPNESSKTGISGFFIDQGSVLCQRMVFLTLYLHVQD